jgi:hypothetical protein
MFLYLIVCLSVINARDITTGQSIIDNPEKLADDKPMRNKNTKNLATSAPKSHLLVIVFNNLLKRIGKNAFHMK